MLHIADIREDIANEDRAGIKDAFRAMIGYPHEAAIDATGDELRAVFPILLNCLSGDDSAMPRAIIAEIEDAVGDEIEGTYHSGAAAARTRMEHWLLKFPA